MDARGNGAISANPMLVPDPNARCTLIAVNTNGGCNFDDVIVGELMSSATAGIEVKSLVTIDNDNPAPTGFSATRIIGAPVGPYLHVPSGTLATCGSSTFAIWVTQWPCQ